MYRLRAARESLSNTLNGSTHLLGAKSAAGLKRCVYMYAGTVFIPKQTRLLLLLVHHHHHPSTHHGLLVILALARRRLCGETPGIVLKVQCHPFWDPDTIALQPKLLLNNVALPLLTWGPFWKIVFVLVFDGSKGCGKCSDKQLSDVSGKNVAKRGKPWLKETHKKGDITGGKYYSQRTGTRVQISWEPSFRSRTLCFFPKKSALLWTVVYQSE